MRRQPVAFFLGDAAFMADAKFRALARRLPDPDDFNSAVGAYFVALAAARRNGLPELDVVMETGSRFFVDLVSVGLVTETGFPERAFRDWAPSRPSRPSEIAPKASPAPSVSVADHASDVSSVSKVSSSSEMASGAASPPLPSTQLPSPSEGGAGGDDGRADLEAFLEVTFRAPTPRQRKLLDDYCRTFDRTGPERAARLIIANPDDPIGAVKADLAAFRAERAAEARAQEAPRPAPRRKPGGLTGINGELAAILNAQYAESGTTPDWEAAHRANLIGKGAS